VLAGHADLEPTASDGIILCDPNAHGVRMRMALACIQYGHKGMLVTNRFFTRLNTLVHPAARMALPFIVLAVCNLAQAQINTEGVRMDNIETLDSARPIVEYIIAGVCIFGSLAIGFKSSNRPQST